MVVYWAHLYTLPASAINKIKQIMARFIWSGREGHQKFYMCKWDNVSTPKELGGWGIIDINIFGSALILKSIWRDFFTIGILRDIIAAKYLHNRGIKYCIILGHIRNSQGL